MKKFTQVTIFVLLISINSLDAQVLAGVTGDLIYTVSTIEQSMDSNPIDNFTEFRDSLDLDGDEQKDIIFISVLSNIPDFGGSTIGIQLINPSLQIIYDSTNAINLPINTPIVADSSWTFSDFSNIAFNFFGIGGLTTGGNWLLNNEGYLGFRMETGGETRYGWIHIFAEATSESVQLIVYGSAIESIINNTEEQYQSKLNIYPNPISSNYINLDLDSYQLQSIRIYNLKGKEVLTSLITEQNQLDISSLANGFYFLQIRLDDGSIVLEKISVQR